MLSTWLNISDHGSNIPAYSDIPGEDHLLYNGKWVTVQLPVPRAGTSLGQEV